MVGRRQLTDPQRWQAIGQLDRGERQVDVAARFGVSQSVVSRLYQRYHQTGKVMEGDVNERRLEPMTVT